MIFAYVLTLGIHVFPDIIISQVTIILSIFKMNINFQIKFSSLMVWIHYDIFNSVCATDRGIKNSFKPFLNRWSEGK